MAEAEYVTPKTIVRDPEAPEDFSRIERRSRAVATWVSAHDTKIVFDPSGATTGTVDVVQDLHVEVQDADSVLNPFRDREDKSFGVTVKITSGDGALINADGEEVQELVVKPFYEGKGNFKVKPKAAGALALGLEDSESTGLTVSDTHTITA